MPGTIRQTDAEQHYIARLQQHAQNTWQAHQAGARGFSAPDSGLPPGPSLLDIRANQVRETHAILKELKARAKGRAR